MKDSEFSLGRKKYSNLLNRRKKYFEKKQRFYDLLKDPLIKEYLEIAMFLSEHSDEEFDLDLLGIKAFHKLAKKTEYPYGIYMYFGKSKDKIQIVNIETLKKIEVSIENYENLKKHNCIVYIENEDNIENFYEDKLLEVRNEYLSNLKDLDPESAKQKLLNKNKNHS